MMTGISQPLMRASEPAAAMYRAVLDVRAVTVADDLSDVRPPVAAHALLRDAVIAADLGFDHLADVLRVAGGRKVENRFHTQNASVGQTACLRGFRSFAVLEEHLAVVLDEHDVRVIILDGQAHRMSAGPERDGDGEDDVALIRHHADGMAAHVRRDGGFFLRRDVADDLKDFLFPSGDDTCGGRRLDALEPIGIRHDDAFDILDDVAAGPDLGLVGQAAQNGAGLRRGIGDGDGLCAAHRRDELLAQDLSDMGVTRIILQHRQSPL